MMARGKRKVSSNNLERLMRAAGEDVHLSEEFHKKTLDRLFVEFRGAADPEPDVLQGPRLVALLDRYIRKTQPRSRFLASPRPYWAVAAMAAAVISAVFVFLPISTSLPPASVELTRAASAVVQAEHPKDFLQAAFYLRQETIRSQLSGALPEKRIMNLEFLRLILSQADSLEMRDDVLFLLEGLSDREEQRHAVLRELLRSFVAAIGMPEAYAGGAVRPYAALLYGGQYRDAAEILAQDNRVNARFLRAWALKEAGEQQESRRLFAELASELTEGSTISPGLPRSMIAYSFLWEGNVDAGLSELAGIADSRPDVHFQVGYFRLHLKNDSAGALSAWRSLPPGGLRGFALGRLKPLKNVHRDIELAYYTERSVPGLGRCLVLAITGSNLDSWTRIRINGSEMGKVHTGTDELLIPLAEKPSGPLHLEISFPGKTLRRTLTPNRE